MIVTFICAATLLVALIVLPLPDRLGFAAWLGGIGLMLISAVLQFSRRCPRCNGLIGHQGRLSLPEHCGSCGVALR